jgi:membrane protease YdiL (CAAX protease family)
LPDHQPSAISPQPSDGHRPSDHCDQPSALSHGGPPLTARVVAFIEVLLCSDFLTQFALGGTFAAFGYQPYVKGTGHLNVAYVVGLSLGDAVLLIALILVLLFAHGERPRDVLFGRRPIVGEAVLGVPMILVAFSIAAVVLVTVQRFAPSLHTVEHNPLQDLLRSPRDAWLFALVVLVAGGVREEIQRAFLLHRFEVWLGGGMVGLIVTSAAFGAGHLLQGVDAAVATGLLGAFWAAVYLRRRSSVAPMVSHAGFDLLQIVQFFFVPK